MGDERDMELLRPIGRNNDAYQNMLHGLVELSRAADDLGFWGLSHVEHHMHSEGLEVSPAPLLLNVYLSQFTERLHHGPLGLVLPAHDPIRLAEEIAITDHMLRGRLFVGMARGYQSRWQNILCQRFGVTATRSDQGIDDARNRLLFVENYKIMKAAWEQDLLRYEGPTYKVPFPSTEMSGWPPAETITRRFGVPGEVDDDDRIVGVSVVPKPFTSPHPPLFQAFGASEETLRWCGKESVVPTILMGSLTRLKKLLEVYLEGANSCGRYPDLGAGTGVCRTFYVYPNSIGEEAAMARLRADVRKYEYSVWAGWYAKFGFMEATRLDGETGAVPRPGEDLADRLLNSGVLIGGTVDQVKRQIQFLLQSVPAEYLIWLFHWGIIPKGEALSMLDLFSNEVMPEFGFSSLSHKDSSVCGCLSGPICNRRMVQGVSH
jgi:alkanesulfonate monooxygenase SsuD/methylene tetrahydromethanopterin reductase-like flavin-dependent oxidoreductase (luciferase family)